MDTTGNKRKDTFTDNDVQVKRPRKVCSYGEDCYRRNPAHFRELSHPHLEKILDEKCGQADYKIPESLRMQAALIKSQLQIIVDHNCYTITSNNNTLKNCTGNTDCPDKKEKDVDKIAKTVSERNINITPQNADKTNLKNVSSNTAICSKTVEEEIVDLTSNSDDRVRNDVEPSQPSQRVGKISLLEVKQALTKAFEGQKPRTTPAENMEGTSSQTYQSGGPEKRSQGPVRRIEDFFSVVLPKGQMEAKHRKAAPYYMFFTTVASAPSTHKQLLSITFQELLDPSLGRLERSLQINFMVDIGWLMAQYYFAGYSKKPLTILYGDETPDIKDIHKKNSNIDTHLVHMASPFGKHHTKMSILCYEDGSLRVVVSTANLYIDDWENRVQGLWLSPRCPALAEDAPQTSGESATQFKSGLISYLNAYRLPCLSYYVQKVQRADFSKINVFFVASVPGGHLDSKWGMLRMRSLLKSHAVVADEQPQSWDVLAQASSIGSYGKDPKDWLTGDFLKTFSMSLSNKPMDTRQPRLRLIYPSLENVRGSHDGLLGGGCLPYSANVQAKQPWLVDFLHQWRASSSGRDRAMPHIKSYTRVSPCGGRASYFHLTSANVSKAAWGVVNKGNQALRIMSYEAGVLFVPKYVIGEEYFTIDHSMDPSDRLPIPYDLPPEPYTSNMRPWVMEYLQR